MDEDILKREYITKQLARTFNKRFENYCITRIWHKLDNPDIQIITQQMFRRKDGNSRENGKIALADLYFPQLRQVVEIDEGQHAENAEADAERIREMQKRFMEVAEDALKDPIRIQIFDKTESNGKIVYTDIGLEQLDQRIDAVVEKIQTMIDSLGDKIGPWTLREKTPEEYRQAGILRASDKAKFRTIVDVAKLFGKEYKKMQRCSFPIGEDRNIRVWCPKLRLVDDDHKGARFDNRISADGKYIYSTANRRNGHFWRGSLKSNEVMYTFPQYRDELNNYAYRFAGIYVVDKELTKSSKTQTWVRIQDYIDFSKI